MRSSTPPSEVERMTQARHDLSLLVLVEERPWSRSRFTPRATSLRIAWVVQGVDIGHRNPADRVALWGIWGGIQVQIHPVPFDYGKICVMICGLKAQLPIEGQHLF